MGVGVSLSFQKKRIVNMSVFSVDVGVVIVVLVPGFPFDSVKKNIKTKCVRFYFCLKKEGRKRRSKHRVI